MLSVIFVSFLQFLLINGQGSWGVDIGKGPSVRTHAQGNIYSGKNWGVDAQAHHQMGRGQKPNYGGSINAHGTYNDGRGNWGVSAGKDKGQRPTVHSQFGGDAWNSRDGNWGVGLSGHHTMGGGRKPDMGISANVHGRFRRDVQDESMPEPVLINRPLVQEEEYRERRAIQEEAEQDLERQKRWTQGQKSDRGSWDVSVNKDKGRGPQVRTEARGNIYTSPNGNVRVDAQGHHEFGKGRKPDYGGSVKVQGRF